MGFRDSDGPLDEVPSPEEAQAKRIVEEINRLRHQRQRWFDECSPDEYSQQFWFEPGQDEFMWKVVGVLLRERAFSRLSFHLGHQGQKPCLTLWYIRPTGDNIPWTD